MNFEYLFKRKGHWLVHLDEKIFQCSICKKFYIFDYKICPNCKTKMADKWENIYNSSNNLNKPPRI